MHPYYADRIGGVSSRDGSVPLREGTNRTQLHRRWQFGGEAPPAAPTQSLSLVHRSDTNDLQNRTLNVHMWCNKNWHAKMTAHSSLEGKILLRLPPLLSLFVESGKVTFCTINLQVQMLARLHSVLAILPNSHRDEANP